METKLALSIDLSKEIIGFNQKPMVYQDNNGTHRNMTVRDALQAAISSLPPKQEFSTLSMIHKMIPKLGNDQEELLLEELEEKNFLVESVKQTEVLSPVAKTFIIIGVLKKTQ